jgi:pimeloyl-ACP methyl ester carboxylesterase
LPSSKEIVTPYTLKKQFSMVKDWFATNWSGVCSQLAKFLVPTLVITGTEDISVPAANSLIVTEKIPGAWLVQIKRGGHGLMYQYPEKLGKIVIAFLESTVDR